MRLVCISTNGSLFLHAGASSLIRSDFISQVPKITMPARQRMAWGRRAQRGRAPTIAEKKSGVNEGGGKEWNNYGDITWKVMNVTVAQAVWSWLKEVWSQSPIRSQRLASLPPSPAVRAPTRACRSQKQSRRSIRPEINTVGEREGRPRAQTLRIHRWRKDK